MTPSFEIRELFHLAFLRHLAPRLNSRPYAVKGGICLRFFHRSPRLSEDVDLDIARIPLSTLAHGVEKILGSQALAAALAGRGIRAIQSRAVKQTETTQRWKIQLVSGHGPALTTRIEFSRRVHPEAAVTGIPSREILADYHCPPFAVRFYDALTMARQKVTAMASENRAAVRDLYDLHHLFTVAHVSPEKMRGLIDPEILRKAYEKTLSFTWMHFQEAVVPFLTAEIMSLYQKPSAFESLRRDVASALEHP